MALDGSLLVFMEKCDQGGGGGGGGGVCNPLQGSEWTLRYD